MDKPDDSEEVRDVIDYQISHYRHLTNSPIASIKIGFTTYEVSVDEYNDDQVILSFTQRLNPIKKIRPIDEFDFENPVVAKEVYTLIVDKNDFVFFEEVFRTGKYWDSESFELEQVPGSNRLITTLNLKQINPSQNLIAIKDRLNSILWKSKLFPSDHLSKQIRLVGPFLLYPGTREDIAQLIIDSILQKVKEDVPVNSLFIYLSNSLVKSEKERLSKLKKKSNIPPVYLKKQANIFSYVKIALALDGSIGKDLNSKIFKGSTLDLVLQPGGKKNFIHFNLDIVDSRILDFVCNEFESSTESFMYLPAITEKALNIKLSRINSLLFNEYPALRVEGNKIILLKDGIKIGRVGEG